MKIKKNYFYFFLIVITTILLSVVFPFVLPARFYYDADLIINDPYNEWGIYGSYPLTMLFYKVTGLKYLPYSIVGLIQLPITFYILKKIGIVNNFHILNLKNLMVYLSFLMIGIFISMPSKEFITYIFIYILIKIIINNKSKINIKLFKVFLLLLFFGILYRPYYVFIPFIAFGMFIISNIKFKFKTVSSIFTGILIIAFMSLSCGVIKGKYFSDFSRDMVNESRDISDDANTMIVSPFDNSTWHGETLSTFYGFFSINLPINALKYFTKPQVLAFIIWQVIITVILLLKFSHLQKNKEKYINEYWLMLILFSYFIIQGVFEPDLGSAIRHKIGVFPLIYYLLYYDSLRKDLQ